ncbi:acetyltransferase [Bacillus mycoides]|uniref:acetyltransferase n=1 Tax=Bacillus cereus group TaxID=86661 RepID=UPI00027BF28C|nr:MULTISPECIES: acetyltransferase [Bacillus cereus group]EJV69993.1 sialic acid O-acetyltransferase NeuD family sugar O-acyltransferase [Bacillus cereus BAG6O-2]OFD40992.1 acetyltransferase [Bacillus mycoides]OFD55041.1 acetyltransferase [Bacillus mycoides]OFD57914.1 acetyltransferase [Bacillus mycoides]OFD62087.1 acetyltransferase [Bacillus mycoides]
MKILIIGDGGHSKVVKDIILSNTQYEIVGYLDDKYIEIILVNGIYFGPISAIGEMINKFQKVKVVIAVGNNKMRSLIFRRLNLYDCSFATLIHKTAVVSPTARLGNGTVVMPYAVINADTIVGEHVIINTGVVIEHDNQIGRFAHVSPHSTLAGSVSIEEGVHVGVAAALIPGVHVGEWATIGAGAVVINDIPPKYTVVGIPARVINVENY